MLKVVSVTLDGQRTEETLLEELSVFPVRPLAFSLRISISISFSICIQSRFDLW